MPNNEARFCLAFLIFFILQWMFLPVSGSDNCITVDSSAKTILVSCEKADLQDIVLQIGDTDMLREESERVWLLNANLIVADNATLFLTSDSLDWLKISSTEATANHVLAKGSLIIDSVKITSWDTGNNTFALAGPEGDRPRSYIVARGGTGIMNISGSELAYLGYKSDHSYGVSYYQGEGSVITDSSFHDNFFGIYLHEVEDIKVTESRFFHNLVYGIDSHTATHDVSISNNTSIYNGSHGIICSVDCYELVIENNEVSNNKGNGIMLHNNVTKSILRKNIVHDNGIAEISLASSNNNRIYDNDISNGRSGIRLSNSSNNVIESNAIRNSTVNGLFITDGSSGNAVSGNHIDYSKKEGILVEGQESSGNILSGNVLKHVDKSPIVIIGNDSVSHNNKIYEDCGWLSFFKRLLGYLCN